MGTGGDIFIVTSASLKVINITSVGSSANRGAFLFASAVSGDMISITKSRIAKVNQSNPENTVLTLNTGTLAISDSIFEDIGCPLFEIKSASVKFTNIIINHVYCASDQEFCVMQGIDLELIANNMVLNEISCNHHIIILQSPLDTTTFTDLQFNKIRKIGVNQMEQFSLILKQASYILIQNSRFYESDISGIKADNSNLNIDQTIFCNSPKQRILQEDLGGLNYGSKISRFLVLTSSNTQITESQFIENYFNTIVEDGGVYFIVLAFIEFIILGNTNFRARRHSRDIKEYLSRK